MQTDGGQTEVFSSFSHHKLMSSSSTSLSINYNDIHESRVVTVMNTGTWPFDSLIDEACWAYMKKFN